MTGERIQIACSGNDTNDALIRLCLSLAPSMDEPMKVGLLLEGNKYDQGWDSQGYEGLVRIERLFHAKVTYYEFS